MSDSDEKPIGEEPRSPKGDRNPFAPNKDDYSIVNGERFAKSKLGRFIIICYFIYLIMGPAQLATKLLVIFLSGLIYFRKVIFR